MHALHHHVQANQGHKIHLLMYYCSNQGLHRYESGVEEPVRTLKTETAQTQNTACTCSSRVQFYIFPHTNCYRILLYYMLWHSCVR